jgi:hypothetical protein
MHSVAAISGMNLISRLAPHSTNPKFLDLWKHVDLRIAKVEDARKKMARLNKF